MAKDSETGIRSAKGNHCCPGGMACVEDIVHDNGGDIVREGSLQREVDTDALGLHVILLRLIQGKVMRALEEV